MEPRRDNGRAAQHEHEPPQPRRDCALTVTLQTRPSDFDRDFVIRYSAIADLMHDVRSVLPHRLRTNAVDERAPP